MPGKPHLLPVRVYYEDTDAAGIVYYANYLRYFERGRTDWLRERGWDHTRLARDFGVVFVVRGAQLEYLRPARLDDALTVITAVASLGKAQLVFGQRVERDGELLVEGNVRVACVRPETGRPTGIPKAMADQLLKELDEHH